MNTGRSGSEPGPPVVYEIRVQGQLDASWTEWFDGMAILCRVEGDGMPVSVLTGRVADQAALRGILSRIWNLNLDVVSVNRYHLAAPQAESTCKQERNGEK